MTAPGALDPAGLRESTVLFTDIVGSTPRWEAEPEIMRRLLAVHDDLLTALVERHDGDVVKRTGDGVVARFDHADQAVACAIESQRALPFAFDAEDDALEVRMGVHGGLLEARLGDLHGPAMNRGARLMSAAHGGQILVSQRVREQCSLPGVSFLALGSHRLKGLLQPERIHQVQYEGLLAEFPPIRSLNATLGNLPLVPHGMVNRVAEIGRLDQALVDERLVTLVGPGGVGKTRLAWHCADRVRSSFPDGVWMVDLAAVREPGRVAATVVRSLGLRPTSDDDPSELVRRTLADRSMLVIVDNCEHLHDEVVDEVAAWSRGLASSTLLCTSQRRIALPGEQVVRVEPLELPDPGEHDEPPALQLFAQRARLADPGFRLDDGNRSTVAAICRELDGLPLAIELAAARCEALTPTQILARLDERLSLLRDRREVDRHQTLQAAIAWSDELAPPESRRLLRALSAFAGPFTWESAAAVAALDEVEALDGLGDLIDRSLVARSGGVLRLLDSVRRFAAVQLEHHGEADEVRRRHADHLAARAATAVDDTDLDVVVGWLEEMAGLEADLRLALETLLRIDPRRAARMALDLVDLWITRNQSHEALEWIGRALDVVDDEALRIELLGWRAGFGWTAGDARSAGWAEEAIALAERAGLPFPALAGTRLAIHCAFAGRPDETRSLADRVREAVVDHPLDGARTLAALGVALAAVGDPRAGVHVADEGVRLAAEIGVLRLTTSRMNRLMITPGRPELVAMADEVAAVCARTGRRQGQGQALLYQAGVAIAEGRAARAVSLVTDAVEVFAAADEWTSVVNSLDNMPAVLASLDPIEALAVAGAVDALHRSLGQTGAPAQVAARLELVDSMRERFGDTVVDEALALGARRSAPAAIDRLRWWVDTWGGDAG